MMRKLQEQEADARVDSAIVAIHENNKASRNNSKQGQDRMIPAPQEWIFELEADREGIDRVNVTIDHQLQQESTVSR
jgi:hypothetical protein